MPSSSMFLSLVVLLLASSSAWGMARGDGLEHIHMYLQVIFTGPNATEYTAVPPRLGGNTTFGMLRLLDNELRDGPDPSNSSLVGRFQGIAAYAGLVSPPGMQSAITFVFTAGKHSGSTLVMMGTILSFEVPFERAVVGGTGAFRMARGYCIIKAVSNPTPVSTVYEVNLFVKVDA